MVIHYFIENNHKYFIEKHRLYKQLLYKVIKKNIYNKHTLK